MQEAFKVVSSPRWQNQATAEEKPNTPDTTNDTATQEPVTASADVSDAIKADAPETAETASGETSGDTLTSELSSDDTGTRADVDDPEAATAAAVSTYDPPGVMETARSPLLAIAAAVAGVAAVWSYTSLEDTRAQLANVSSAKAALERSLADAQSKLAVAEKTVADVKAAIAAATAAPAKSNGSAAAK